MEGINFRPIANNVQNAGENKEIISKNIRQDNSFYTSTKENLKEKMDRQEKIASNYERALDSGEVNEVQNMFKKILPNGDILKIKAKVGFITKQIGNLKQEKSENSIKLNGFIDTFSVKENFSIVSENNTILINYGQGEIKILGNKFPANVVVKDKEMGNIQGKATKINNGILVKLSTGGEIKFYNNDNKLFIDIGKSGFDVPINTIIVSP